MELALFDLDNTLLSGDSDYEWAQFLVEEGVLDRDRYAMENRRFYDQYKAGNLDIFEFLDFQLAPLARYPRRQLDLWHDTFMQRKILPIIREKGRSLLDRHRASGSLCAIITATNAFVTEPIAREFGVEHLLATELEVIDGGFTGRPHGTPCFREGKVARVDQWLHAQGMSVQSFSASWFYSDSLNDLPLLEYVTRPVAVDPDDVLRRTARERGWDVISLE
ncbi:MAG: phosphoserine phosphatase [Betaproteobacteria bacterium RIFCSPLOWO2_02_FULL_63_19]|nr:MAG: phosphoserine phosphatase [Betaproteobacteria bacterium RIFCSPLOWO2_02_FULL_63_19]